MLIDYNVRGVACRCRCGTGCLRRMGRKPARICDVIQRRPLSLAVTGGMGPGLLDKRPPRSVFVQVIREISPGCGRTFGGGPLWVATFHVALSTHGPVSGSGQRRAMPPQGYLDTWFLGCLQLHLSQGLAVWDEEEEEAVVVVVRSCLWWFRLHVYQTE